MEIASARMRPQSRPDSSAPCALSAAIQTVGSDRTGAAGAEKAASQYKALVLGEIALEDTSTVVHPSILAQGNLTTIGVPKPEVAESSLFEVSSNAGLTTQAPALWQSLATILQGEAKQIIFPAVDSVIGLPDGRTVFGSDAPGGNQSRPHLQLLQNQARRHDIVAPFTGMAATGTHPLKVDRAASRKPRKSRKRARAALHHSAADTLVMGLNMTNMSHEAPFHGGQRAEANVTASASQDRGEARVRTILAVGSILALICVRLHACLGPVAPSHRCQKTPEDLLAEVYAEAKRQQIQAAALLSTAAASADVRL